mmetsp:Transcript_15156/g.53198  ORF Transcript_15156/g.53198 Transcript_15156/m.53198 type:complete len:248 (-) Transcript_15156:411-1154(-)
MRPSCGVGSTCRCGNACTHRRLCSRSPSRCTCKPGRSARGGPGSRHSFRRAREALGRPQSLREDRGAPPHRPEPRGEERQAAAPREPSAPQSQLCPWRQPLELWEQRARAARAAAGTRPGRARRWSRRARSGTNPLGMESAPWTRHSRGPCGPVTPPCVGKARTLRSRSSWMALSHPPRASWERDPACATCAAAAPGPARAGATHSGSASPLHSHRCPPNPRPSTSAWATPVATESVHGPKRCRRRL